MSALGPYVAPSARVGRAALYSFCALVFAFLTLPILAIIPLSFNSGSFLSYPLAGFSLRWYREILGENGWLPALGNSLFIAGAVTALATPLGTLAALGLARLSSALKPMLIALILAPLFVPVVIVAVAIYFVYAPLGLTGSFLGLVLAHTALAVPFVVIVVHAALQGFDSSLLRAGASLGASPVRVLWRVLLPLIGPSVVAGAILAFMASFDEIVVALFLAGTGQKTLPLKMFEGVRDQLSPAITAAATLLVVTSIVLISVAEWLRRRTERRS